MPLKGDYNAKLLEELLVDYLRTGRIPTLEQLTDELDTLKKAKPQLGDKPLFSLEDNSVAFYENASASKTNDTFTRYAKDVDVLWNSIQNIKEDVVKNARKWASAYDSSKRFLEALEDRIDNLLLMETETLGYYQYVSDDFSTTDYSDLTNSNVLIDTGTGIITIPQDVNLTEPARIDLTSLKESNLSLIVSNASGFKSEGLAVNSSLLNALKDEYSTWLHYVRTTEQAPVTVVLTIDTLELQEVNKVIYKLNGSTIASPFTVTLMYSPDNIDYLPVPINSYTQTGLDSIAWVFPTVNSRFWKFLITKNGADDKDDELYLYEFGAKNISFYQTGYDASGDTDYVFLSSDREALDSDGVAINFTKCTLSVCQEIPDKTSIDYYVSVNNSGTYLPIAPIEEDSPSKPHILDFADVLTLSNIGSTNLFNSLLDDNVIHTSTLTSYDLVNETDAVLNWYLTTSEATSLDVNSVTVFRNTGDNTATTETVRGVARGWSYDKEANVYSTVVRVDRPDGLDLDFGQTTITIDGIEKTGIINLSQGIHDVVVNGNNWLSIAENATTLDELKSLDLLYPYNHKLLIEGYNYDSTYEDEKLYLGVALWAERISTYIPSHEFNTQTDQYNLDAYTRTLDDNDKTIFVFKTDKTYTDNANERFLVEYSVAEKTFSSIVLKAVLATSDPSVTPLLDGYTIKLG